MKSFIKRFPILSSLLAMAMIIVLIIVASLVFLNFWTHHGETSTVPDVRSMTIDGAKQILIDADLAIVVSDSIYDDTKPGGTIVEVWPKPGAVVKAGREVYLTIVSYSPRMVVIDMPLTDISVKQAQNYLTNHGITSIKTVYVKSDYPQMVLGAKVGNEYVTLGSRIPANSTVVLEVGEAPDVYDSELDAEIDSKVDSIIAENEKAKYFD